MCIAASGAVPAGVFHAGSVEVGPLRHLVAHLCYSGSVVGFVLVLLVFLFCWTCLTSFSVADGDAAALVPFADLFNSNELAGTPQVEPGPAMLVVPVLAESVDRCS